MPTTRKRQPLSVLAYCHNCKPTSGAVVHAQWPQREVCDTCGRETWSGVYVVQHHAQAFGNTAAGT